MMSRSSLILTTSPQSQAANKPCGIASLTLRRRLLYGRKRHYHTGKERDSETGLHYYGARYLDSRTGRWISGDPAMGEYVPEAPVSEEARKRNGSLPGMGGVFNYANLHAYHYAGNNPVKLVDPDGEWVVLVGFTGTAGVGTGFPGETGIAISKDNAGNYQVGTYNTNGAGLYAGVGASLTLSGTFAPLAQKISDLEGYTEAIGASFTIPRTKILTAGADVNIPVNSSIKNASITLSFGIGKGAKKAEGHSLTTYTTTKVYVEGKKLSEVWAKAIETGVLKGIATDVLEQFKLIVKDLTGERIP